jgi:hypothetical protein
VSEEAKLKWEKQKFVIAAVSSILLFLIGLWQFSITSRNEFAKPVLQKQLDFCVDAAGSAAVVADDFENKRPFLNGEKAREFTSLYYGRMGIVEDRCVYASMVAFHRVVFENKPSPSETTASRLALGIAFACRRMLSQGWRAGLVRLYDPHNLFENFTDLADYENVMKQVPECSNR